MLCSTNNFICLNLYKLLIFIFYFFNRKVRKGVAKVAEFFLCVLCVKTWRSLRFLFLSVYIFIIFNQR